MVDTQIRIADHGSAFDFATIDDDPLNAARPDQDLGHIAANSSIDSILGQFGLHLADEIIGSALIDKDPFGHEVGKDDSIGDRRVLEGRTIGISDRLHQQSNNIFAAWKELFKELAGRHRLVIVEIHSASSVEELIDAFGWDSKLRRQ